MVSIENTPSGNLISFYFLSKEQKGPVLYLL